MSETPIQVHPRPSTVDAVGRKVGYVVAAGVNLFALWVANQLLSWAWPPFLTGAFEELLPILTVSFVASAAVNLLWVVWEPAWFRHLAQAALDAIGVAVVVRTWQVFPFDLSSGWETAARVALVLAVVAIGVATVVESVKAVASVGEGLRPGAPHRGRAHPV